ncbi:MAG: Ig-like domain-containing protein [Clostridiales bacterium]|nr:Ig-like domain-containing protein [Clostridiales bacterium]
MNTYINSKRGKTFKMLVAAFAVLALVAGIVLVPGTLAANEDITEVLQVPNSLTSIEVGETLTDNVINLFQAKSADETIAKVTATVGVIGTVEIQGVNAGVVGVVSGTKNGLVFADMYQITDSNNISMYVIRGGRQVSLKGPGAFQETPVMIPQNMGSIESITWKSLNESVASVNAATGAITGVSNGAAIVIGEFIDKWGVERDLHIQVVVGNIGGGTGGGTGGELIEGEDGNWYKPVGEPPNVYEKVDEDGNSLTEPPEYVYNPDGQPGNGNDEEAVKDGNNYYVENPENIWTPVGPDGSLNEDGAIWGGADGKPGGGDDKPVGKYGGEYWVKMGQNVYKKVLGPFTLGPLTGGGPDMDPSTDPVTPIYENDGKYYVGPLGSGDDEYYYGDPTDGNGTLDSTATSTEKDDVTYYKDSNGNMTTTKPSKPIVEIPTVAGGRELGTDKTGDTVKWIEIATNGDYSLIMRSDFINVNPNNKGKAEWQGIMYGSNNNYKGSNLQVKINEWFNGNSTVENLSSNARLRSFTVSNNASTVLGSGASDTGGLTDGFSKPTTQKVGVGSDIAFALSFTEAANFVSKTYNVTLGGGNNPSSSAAVSNFGKLVQYSATDYLWLRSPGTNSFTATAMQHDAGRAFQMAIGTNPYLVYPALWVETAVFN